MLGQKRIRDYGVKIGILETGRLNAITVIEGVAVGHATPSSVLSCSVIHEEEIDIAFRAIGKATEEAVLNSLVTATRVVGRDGNERPALKDLIEKYQISLT